MGGVDALRAWLRGEDSPESDAAAALLLECLLGARSYLRALAKVKPKGGRK